MMIEIYWIHLPDETDPFSQGYVGITKRGVSQRFKEHKRDKVLSDDYIIEVLETCEDIDTAYSREKHFRPHPGIGLNLNEGGNMPYPSIPKHKAWREAIGESNSKPKTGISLTATLANQKKAVEATRGKKNSEKTIRKRIQSLKKRYKSNPELWAKPQQMKKILAEGTLYISQQEVASTFGVCRQTVDSRCKSEKWNWKYV